MSKVYDDLIGKSLEPFFASFKSEETKENYAVKLRHFLNQENQTPDSVTLAKKHPTKAELLLVSYITKRKQESLRFYNLYGERRNQTTLRDGRCEAGEA
ncbi:MAG: hypothetical protein ACYC9U_03905 [Nitrososphaerales archaeon]